jgi:hypothetical protein
MRVDLNLLTTVPMPSRHPEDQICLRIGHAWWPASVTVEHWRVLSHVFGQNERDSIF